jgi:hypothetical protein
LVSVGIRPQALRHRCNYRLQMVKNLTTLDCTLNICLSVFAVLIQWSVCRGREPVVQHNLLYTPKTIV